MKNPSLTQSTLLAVLTSLSLASCGNGAKTTGGTSRTPASGKASNIVLTWDARKGKAAESFNIYGMPTPNDAEVPLKSIQASATNFDPQKPSATLTTADQKLKAYVGKGYCFSVTAVVGGVESAASKPACGTL